MGKLDSLFKRRGGAKSSAATPSAYGSGAESEADRSGGTVSMGAQSTSSRIPLTKSSGASASKEAKRREKHILRRQNESTRENIAMETFQRRISQTRESVNPYTQNRAPGWDYINWKPYGWYRYDYNPDDYQQRCESLSPYVRCVITSACQGSREKRWENLTAGKHGEGLYSRTMSQSRLAASRTGSQASISNVGRM